MFQLCSRNHLPWANCDATCGDPGSPQLTPQNAGMEPENSDENVNSQYISLASLHILRSRVLHFGDAFTGESRYNIGRSARRSRHLRERFGDQRKRTRAGDRSMKKFLLGTVGLIALGRGTRGRRRSRCASLHQGARRRSPPSMTGAASTSAPTAAGVRAAIAGTSSTRRGVRRRRRLP